MDIELVLGEELDIDTELVFDIELDIDHGCRCSSWGCEDPHGDAFEIAKISDADGKEWSVDSLCEIFLSAGEDFNQWCEDTFISRSE